MLRKEYGDGEFCPDVQGKCIERKCKAWMQIHGTDPQTGARLDEWGCFKYQWHAKLLLEISQQTRQAGAATESFRNETVKRQDVLNVTMGSLVQLAAETKKIGNG